MNTAGYAIIWGLLLVVSIMFIFEFIGLAGIVRIFPEGRRWWQAPIQFASLGLFAALILNHPFG